VKTYHPLPFGPAIPEGHTYRGTPEGYALYDAQGTEVGHVRIHSLMGWHAYTPQGDLVSNGHATPDAALLALVTP
jgi:hypothetical protein